MKNNRKRKVNKPKQKTLNKLKQFNLYFTNQPGSNGGGGWGEEKCPDLTLIKTFLKIENFVPICSLSRSLQKKKFVFNSSSSGGLP